MNETVKKTLIVLATLIAVFVGVPLIIAVIWGAAHYQTPYQQYTDCVQTQLAQGNDPDIFCTPPG